MSLSLSLKARHAVAALLRNSGFAYLLKDEFTTADAAPIASPRTCEPGPGTLTLVQTDGEQSIANGVLNFTAQTTAGWGDCGFYGPATTRAAGIAFFDRVTPTTTTGYAKVLELMNAAALSTVNNDARIVSGFYCDNTGALDVRIQGSLSIVPGTSYTAAARDFAIVLRATGSFLLSKLAATTAWTLVWVENVSNAATVYPTFNTYSMAGTLDDFRVVNLGTYDSRFSGDYTLATSRTASPILNTTGTHTADALIELSGTVPTADATSLLYRSTGDAAGWRVDVNTDGNVYLQELNAGTTQRGSAAHGLADAAAYRVVVIVEGNVHKVYVNNSLKITYTDGGNFQNTATAAKVLAVGTGDTLSNLIAWPRSGISLPSGI